MESVQRRLSAIVCADVAGYSRLVGIDEEGTLARLKTLRRELIDPKIAEHHGRIVKTTGDGALIEFASAVDAVRCMLELQQAMAARNVAEAADRRIEFRIGINVGDIVIDGEDILGDGVNVAARLETLAEPGSICVSRAVRDATRDKLPVVFKDGGQQQVKNIARPVQVYRVRAARPPVAASPAAATTRRVPVAAVVVAGALSLGAIIAAGGWWWTAHRPAPPAAPAGAPVQAAAPAPVADAPLPLPDKPSIAVLPFANMSGDKEQEYFADGVAEDIITALTRFPSLFVIARNSSFTYKGQSVDARQVGRELGVRFILEGSVRKAGNRVRVTGQLIDAATGSHLWAEQYDGELSDIFALQDRITGAVAGAIAPTITRVEIERVRRVAPRNFDAYDLWLRGLSLHYEHTRENTRESNARALELFEQAIQADPAFAPALIGAARCWSVRRDHGWAPAREAQAQMLAYAERALRLEPDNPDTLAYAAYAIVLSRGHGLTRISLEEAAAMAKRAVALNPNSAMVLIWSGWLHLYVPQPETTIAHIERALRLSPKDLFNYAIWAALSRAFLEVERDQDAIVAAQTAVHYAPNSAVAWRTLVPALALAGRLDDARTAATRLLELQPNFRLSAQRTWFGRINPTASFRILEGYRLAGLPE